jgi:hypothetical protein
VKKLSAFFDFLHKSFVFLLFIGMLTVAGVSLVSLSPVPYEEYQEYVAKLNDYYEEKSVVQTQGEVAGIYNGNDNEDDIDVFNQEKSKNATGITLENFLEKSEVKYSLMQDEESIELKFSLDENSNKAERVKLMRLTNTNKSKDLSKLCLLQCKQEMLGVGLVGGSSLEEIQVESIPYEVLQGMQNVSDFDSVKAYALNLEPNELVDLSLFVNSDFGNLAGGSNRLDCALNVVDYEEESTLNDEYGLKSQEDLSDFQALP